MNDLDPNAAPVLLPPADGEAYSEEELERAVDQGEISRLQAEELSGQVAVEHTVDKPTTKPARVEKPGRRLELVTDEHVPLQGARREPKYKKPSKSRGRNARQKLAADQAPLRQRVTPFGHDLHVTVREGGHRKPR